MDDSALFFFFFVTFIVFLSSNLSAQQLYSGNSALDCNISDEGGPYSSFLYSCNDDRRPCLSFLIFRSQYPYNSVISISKLTSSNPIKLARINNVSSTASFPRGKEVIVPVSCSCSGWYYQANTSYVTPTDHETYFTIANTTYQGLSTCSSLMKQNVYGELELGFRGLKLRVPLRCGCPTRNQTKHGTKFLLTYLVTWGDTVPKISQRFNVSPGIVASANGFSVEDPVLYPFTTLLIPLKTRPSSAQTRVLNPPPAVIESKRRLYVFIGSALCVIGVCLAVFVGYLCHRMSTIRKKRDEEKKKQLLVEDLRLRVASVDQVLKVYEFDELKVATENFSPKNAVDRAVYRGVLRGKRVAIKRTSEDVCEEVKILSKINHSNIISLYGVSEDDGVLYLVYEFMETGSLKTWLHKPGSEELQSWNRRIKIALDVASGLHYLHNFTDPAYVHRAINTENVLLNKDLRAKIAYFRLASSAESVETGLVTPTKDVYDFGMVLLELITGREASFEDVLLVVNNENAESEVGFLIDPNLQVKHPLGYIIDHSELALRLMKLSVACLVNESERRLSMAEVVSTLMKIHLDAEKSDYSYSS